MNSTLPELCMSVNETTGELINLKRGESGYFTSDWNSEDKQRNRETADYFNEQRGITKAQEAAMYSGSMLGWEIPAANPENYDEQGNPIKPTEEKEICGGYEIIERYAVGNSVFVIGHNLNAASEFVTWQAKSDDPKNYFWGHYQNSLKSAQKDFKERVACEALSDMDYSTRIIRNRREPER